MNIDLNQLQEEALKKEAEELEQEGEGQQPEQVDEPTKEKKTSSRESKISKAITGAAVALSATALGINFIPKPECVPNDTTALTALQQENEELREQNQVLEASRKIRGREFRSLKERLPQEEELKELKEKAEKVNELEHSLKELMDKLRRIQERRSTNKDNAQSRQDYKEWLRRTLEELAACDNNIIQGRQQWIRTVLPGEEGQTTQILKSIGGSLQRTLPGENGQQIPESISGSLTNPLGGEEGQDLGILDGSNGAMYLGQSDIQMDQLARIISLFMSLDNTAFADGRHQYKTKQEMLDGVEEWLEGFLQVQNQIKEKHGE